jgi:hypothetical protein
MLAWTSGHGNDISYGWVWKWDMDRISFVSSLLTAYFEPDSCLGGVANVGYIVFTFLDA